jgi:predicted  nucleic acid-binding Zn-ribbon protein
MALSFSGPLGHTEQAIDDLIRACAGGLFDWEAPLVEDDSVSGLLALPLIRDPHGGMLHWQPLGSSDDGDASSSGVDSPSAGFASNSSVPLRRFEASDPLSDDDDDEVETADIVPLVAVESHASGVGTRPSDEAFVVSEEPLSTSSEGRAASRPAALSEPRREGDGESVKQQGLLTALRSEKSRLKRHLRALDDEFERKHGRRPARSDKEHLRPQYERYRSLKREIDKMEASLARDARSGEGGLSSEPAPPRVEVSEVTSEEERAKELADLRGEKRQLQMHLRKYEEDFRKANGRAVQFHRDIRPVEADYRRYKDLKRRISKLEGAGVAGSSRRLETRSSSSSSLV